jgi:hypothetical protein
MSNGGEVKRKGRGGTWVVGKKKKRSGTWVVEKKKREGIYNRNTEREVGGKRKMKVFWKL